MDHHDVAHFIALLALTLVAAKLLGALAQRLGQPAVLGELLAGVIVGVSVLGLVVPHSEVWDLIRKEPIPFNRSKLVPFLLSQTLHLLAQVGVVILLFEIGLQTDLRKLIQVGGAATSVAAVGVILPFAMGYAVCRLLGHDNLVAIMAGAALTATSVGITARVLADLGRLQEPESQIVLGAAVIDDVIGLVILTVVAGLVERDRIGVWEVATIAAVAVGFVVATLLLGALVLPVLFRLASRIDLPGTATMLAVIVAFALAWLADTAGSAIIIGAFAAGLLMARIPQAAEIERGVAHLGHFFVPLFFVVIGANVNVGVLNPFEPGNWPILRIGGLLLLVAVVGKFLAGYVPFWSPCKKSVIGVGMIPRGEVGLIFAGLGLGVPGFGRDLYSAVIVMVMVTTFLAPPLLKLLLPPRRPEQPPPGPEGIEELVTEA